LLELVNLPGLNHCSSCKNVASSFRAAACSWSLYFFLSHLSIDHRRAMSAGSHPCVPPAPACEGMHNLLNSRAFFFFASQTLHNKKNVKKKNPAL
jgi:hypothetical protein